MLFQISTPLGNERSPAFMDQVLTVIHQANARRLPISLNYWCAPHTVTLLVRYPPELKAIVEGQLANAYPECKVSRLPEDALDPPKGFATYRAYLSFRPEIFLLRDYSQFEDKLKRTVVDPITGLLSTLTPEKRNPLYPRIEITLRPASRFRCRMAECIVRRITHPFFVAHPFLAILYARAVTSRSVLIRCLARCCGSVVTQAGKHRAPGTRAAHVGAFEKCNGTLFDTQIRLTVFAPKGRAERAKAKIREIAGAFGQFNPARLIAFELSHIR
ncbi:MAG: hypothetical protein IH987_05950, partial [Planctomycetes bacterium]|nr:hypothetical protein [Planctomycetota bacterium]